MTIDNLKKVRPENSRIFRNKRGWRAEKNNF
jgi:hypothetical protein